ncbi:MAG TPA: universal stress protein [Candidatus Saccharimonadia bacterium]|nr:universal stress protein [Candidatus Saccharimonadia bacterium]
MSLREIVLHVRRPDAPGRATEAAFALAHRFEAYVTAIHAAAIAPTAFAAPEAVALSVVDASRDYADAVAHRQSWNARFEQAKVAGEWQVVQADDVEALSQAARAADLVVIERPTMPSEAPVGWGIASRTAFAAGVPVLVVPDTARVADRYDHLVVAYDGGPQATRALHRAVPLLKAAREVIVLNGCPAAATTAARHLPLLDAAAYLSRNEVTAHVQRFDAQGRETGPALLDAARAAGAECIVMGAWGHSRIAQLVLGGATRHLLQHSDVPLFVSH